VGSVAVLLFISGVTARASAHDISLFYVNFANLILRAE